AGGGIIRGADAAGGRRGGDLFSGRSAGVQAHDVRAAQAAATRANASGSELSGDRLGGAGAFGAGASPPRAAGLVTLRIASAGPDAAGASANAGSSEPPGSASAQRAGHAAGLGEVRRGAPAACHAD